MKALIILLACLALLSGNPVGGQTPSAIATNVTLDIRDDKVIILYDLLSNAEGSKHTISIFFSDYHYANRSYPVSITGDVGDSIIAGTAHQVIWDFEKDMQHMQVPLQCNVVVDGVLGDGKTGGPSNAWLSLAVPGLGDYFVADHRYMRFKPWYRTMASAGFITLGAMAFHERQKIMRFVPGHWEVIYSPYGSISHEWWIPDRLVTEGTDYFLFRDDGEILLALGTALWVMDIIWVMNRGRDNRRLADLTSQKASVELHPVFSLQSGIPQAGLCLRF